LPPKKFLGENCGLANKSIDHKNDLH